MSNTGNIVLAATAAGLFYLYYGRKWLYNHPDSEGDRLFPIDPTDKSQGFYYASTPPVLGPDGLPVNIRHVNWGQKDTIEKRMVPLRGGGFAMPGTPADADGFAVTETDWTPRERAAPQATQRSIAFQGRPLDDNTESKSAVF